MCNSARVLGCTTCEDPSLKHEAPALHSSAKRHSLLEVGCKVLVECYTFFFEDEDMAPDAGGDATLGGKRRRNADDEDLGSQQSILKWMRHVPGPLQDVMKKRADQLDGSQGDHSRIASANSDRYSVAIATVFDQGPWVEMCQYLGMPAVSGTLYGSIKIRSLKCTVQNIVEDDEALAKVPQLLVLVKSVRYVDEEIVAVLHDPTGEVEGYFHRELVEQLGPALVAGVGVLLYKVSVFTPTDAPVTGRRKSYLNITPRNVRRIFVTNEQVSTSLDENPVEVFNKEKEIEYQQESDNDDDQASRSEQAARQLLQHSTVRDTSAELTFLSQRQVVHRNPPVRVDPAAATTTKKKGKRGKGAAASKGQSEESGVGKWQWSKLLKKTADGSDDESTGDSSRVQERRGFMDASSRLMSLIMKQNSRSRLPSSDNGSNNQETSPAPAKQKKQPTVRFAPGTAFEPPRSPRNSDNRDVMELTQRSPPTEPSDSQSHSAGLPVARDNISNNSDEEEDDDDW
ncbi:hypothetical protein PR002_g22406 [Phytophthora rubi]|uniref:Homologous recombination OB-fold protein OB-fold domain-containing protein n=1 Tax=Phytophthora rubi TaxID=129364 RepID=A0A6A3ITA1_9STRA|nr:hypothetical protein PR002_g22406 [Phytophthora rubi]